MLCQNVIMQTSLLGITEEKRSGRRKRNLVTTGINFIAWTLQVSLLQQRSKKIYLIIDYFNSDALVVM